MTILNKSDIGNLRRSYIQFPVSDEMMARAKESEIIGALARKAAQGLAEKNFLASHAIEAEELTIERHKDLDYLTVFCRFSWEPSMDNYSIRLKGGHLDGRIARAPEHCKGEIFTKSYSGTPADQETVNSSSEKCRYIEAGWNTEEKVWIYELAE